MERLVGESLSRYQLTKLLGEGGMGAVFEARDVTLQRDVAIKIMHPHLSNQPDFRERFLQEARTAARLDHPGIVQVYDFGQERSLLFIVMEFIRGANLRTMLDGMKAKGQWIPLKEAIGIIRQTSEAMDYAHRQGVLHRDIKPSNIMIEPEASPGLPYRPVLTDLGLARLMASQHITQAGTSMGTPTYMSPEQALGEEADPRSDVYSLGVMLYELCVGRPPFEISTISEAIRYHTKETPPAPSTFRADLPKSLEAIILKAIAKRPADRWENAGALAAALGKLSGASAGEPEPTAVASEKTALADEPGPDVGAPPARPGGIPAVLDEGVSLMTQYQQSQAEPRGASVLQDFSAPKGNGDTIQARLRDGRTLEVQVKSQSMTVGRTEGNDIVLDTPNVSRHHARIENDGTTYRVTDLDSTNGTYIGTAKLLPGVAETWTPDQPLRVGDAWLRLVAGTARAATGRLGGASVGASPPSPGGRGTAGVSPGLLRTSTGEGRVGVVMEETQLAVTPGQRTVGTLVLLNQGSIVDHFRVVVEGIPADWVDLPPVVQLMPGQQQTVTLTLHPPRTPASQAGRYGISIRVFSRDMPSQSVEVNAALTVAPFQQFSSSMQPQKVKVGSPTRVTVQNDSNFPDTYSITGSDRANELAFEPPQAQIRVPQGQTGSADLVARPVKRRLIGGAKTHSFAVQVAPSQGDAQQHGGEMVSNAIIPTWVMTVAMALLLVACAALALLLTRPPVITLAEVVPQNAEAGQPVTVRWQVTNARNIELRPFGVQVDPSVGEYTFPDGFPENTTVTIVASNMLRSTKETLNIQVVNVVTDPVIVEWSVFPTDVTLGQEVTIRWSVTNADSVTLQPFGTVDASGERKDTPQQTQTYTLIASNQGRTIQKAQQVIVATPAPDAPEVTSFTVTPTTAVEGSSSTIQLAWETNKADTVTIEPGLGPVGLSGSRDVPVPATDTVYTLVAKGPGGEVQAQVQVHVQAQQCLAGGSEIHLRSGPGTVYDPPIDTLPSGTQLKPLAYSSVGYPDGTWVKVQVVSSGEEGWVAQSLLADCNVDVTGLGSATIPPTPVPPFEVTNIQISVDPTSYTGICSKDFTFSAQITVIGSGTVTYKWERSDGADVAEETIDFASPGTQSVNTTWSIGGDGTYWQQLHVLSPNDVTSDQASFTVDCKTSAIYIYAGDATAANQFKSLLEANDYQVDVINQSAVMSTDFSKYRLVLIGADTGSGGNWGDGAGNQANRIKDANGSVLGLGAGGASFFDKIGVTDIGWGQSWVGSGARQVYAADPSNDLWTTPNAISVPGSQLVTLYNSDSGFVAVFYPSSVSGVAAVGRQSDNTNHYTIISKSSQYLLWGFSGPPSTMTDTGRQVLVNAAKSILGLRIRLIGPPQILHP